MSRLAAREHDGEPQPGLPEALPAGERLLWQGAPDARVLARRAFHLRGLALYFAVLIVWRIAHLVGEGASLGGALVGSLPLALLAVLVLGFVRGFAQAVQATTLYTLTDRRVVLRIGVVLTITFNLPLQRIEAAQLRRHPDGSGDIALRLLSDDRIGVLHLWPHCRPWRLARAEPMLRGLANVAEVGRCLADALGTPADQTRAAVAATGPRSPGAASPGAASTGAAQPVGPHLASGPQGPAWAAATLGTGGLR